MRRRTGGWVVVVDIKEEVEEGMGVVDTLVEVDGEEVVVQVVEAEVG